MPRQKNTSTDKPAKGGKKAVAKEERLEDILFSCRNHLRGRAPMTDKRDLLLTLVFLKFIGDRFNARKAEILAENADDPGLAEIAVKTASFYKQVGVFFLPDECLWSELIKTESRNMAVAFDTAIAKLEQNEEKLRNALPQQIFTKTALEPSVIRSVVDDINRIDPARFTEKDLIGRVYEYFLQAFSVNADKEEGEFYTPRSIVELIASLIEPFDGTIYDPCCGSGGMFVQSAKFIEAHGGNTHHVTVYGQESEPSTFRLAKMNLAVRGISYHLGDKAASTFTHDHHKDRRMDYIMANPPFNLKKYWSPQLDDDPRWGDYGTPPDSNANYAWILHMLSKLDVRHGVAGFLLANGALDDSDTLAIRRKLLENDKVEAIIVLPRNMFYSTDISVTLWILNNNKKGGMWHGRRLRNREHEFLFVDLRTWNSNIYEKKYVEFIPEQIEEVCRIYHNWQTLENAAKPASYACPELYYSAGIKEVEEKNWCLAPSRYIEFVDRDQALDFDAVLSDVGAKSSVLISRQKVNQEKLTEAFKTLGYRI
ncbi:MAG: N-6 DNA methylase [Akkermansia sp.]